jgi:hypothetical protein
MAANTPLLRTRKATEQALTSGGVGLWSDVETAVAILHDRLTPGGATGQTQTVFISAARTATPTAVELSCVGARAVTLVLSVTAVTDTPALTITVSGKTGLGIYYTLLASTAVATVSTYLLHIGTGLAATANISANIPLPSVIRVACAHGDSDSATYSIEAIFCH